MTCKDCTERTPTCHATCDRYKQYVTEREALRAKRCKENNLENGLNASRIDRCIKRNKNKRR